MNFRQTLVVVDLDLDASGERNEGWAGGVDGEVLVIDDAPAWLDPVRGAGFSLKYLLVNVLGIFHVGLMVDVIGEGGGDALASE